MVHVDNLRRYEADVMPQNWFHSRDHYGDNEEHGEDAATGGGQLDNTFEGSEDNHPGLGVSRFGRVRQKPQYLKHYHI